MSDDQFTKLFKYMQGIHTEMQEGFKRVDKRFDHVYSVLDSILKQLESHDQELLIADYQRERHEGWIKQLAENTQTQLTPEP
jgi:hypothetical protein